MIACSRQGASLLEVMVTMLLIGLGLAVVGSIVKDYSSYNRNLLSSNDSTRNAQMAVLTIVQEVEQATVITSPAPSGVGSALDFVRWRPTSVENIDVTLPMPRPATPIWQPGLEPQLKVRYEIMGNDLVRRVLSGGSSGQSIVLRGCQDFEVRRQDDSSLTVRVLARQGASRIKAVGQAFWRIP